MMETQTTTGRAIQFQLEFYVGIALCKVMKTEDERERELHVNENWQNRTEEWIPLSWRDPRKGFITFTNCI